jgi:ATP-dependent protease ClpP protease subunit
MRKILLMLVAMLSTGAAAETFTANPKRTVYLNGVVAGNAMEAAEKIEKLSRNSDEDIDIIINSPGGYITPGLQMVSAMNVAQKRGVTVRCFVPMLAASMAFQVFAECDERYALKYSRLLWHPARTGFRGGVKWGTLLYESKRLRSIEKILVGRLLELMDINKKFFFYHFKYETLWYAENLKKHTPKFFTIVDDFKNVNKPYQIDQ